MPHGWPDRLTGGEPAAAYLIAMAFMHRRRLLTVLLGALTSTASAGAGRRARAGVAISETELAKAIETARRTLPQFWERLAANEPHETGYALKIVAADQHGSEHLWVTRLHARDRRLYGFVDTAPRRVRSIRSGHELEIRTDAIVDWMFFRNGRMVGNHTGRVLLRYLPPAEAEKLLQLYE